MSSSKNLTNPEGTSNALLRQHYLANYLRSITRFLSKDYAIKRTLID